LQKSKAFSNINIITYRLRPIIVLSFTTLNYSPPPFPIMLTSDSDMAAFASPAQPTAQWGGR
jgi:hypothetical protein